MIHHTMPLMVPHACEIPVRKHAQERGYALFLALLMIMILLVSSAATVTMMSTQARRQREEEMIWRGGQYKRAIRSYYHKTGHYPQTIDDLMKGVPSVHFLRKEYTDPMNKDDGKWRLIYVNAAGQITCSVRYATLQQMAFLDLNGGGLAPAQPGQAGSQTGTTPDQSSPSTGAAENPNASQAGQSPQATSQSGQGSSFGQTSSFSQQGANPMSLLKPTGPCSGPVIGGFLTGVASTVDAPSLKVYKGAKKYIEWEFIWNPIEEQAAALQQGLGQTSAQPGQPNALGGNSGGILGNPGNPTSTPQPTPPQQPQQPLQQ
jgi:type II secretory pathway pseudopilin PulG